MVRCMKVGVPPRKLNTAPTVPQSDLARFLRTKEVVAENGALEKDEAEQTDGLRIGETFRKPGGTLLVVTNVQTKDDDTNSEYDYPWCRAATADGGEEEPTQEQVKEWRALFEEHGPGAGDLPSYEQLVESW